MRPGDYKAAKLISEKIEDYSQNHHPLPGIVPTAALGCLVNQIIDSIRRIKYVTLIRDKNVSKVYTDPQQSFYDPIKAASWYHHNNLEEEACWQVFLATHFGKNKRSAWNLGREVYNGKGSGGHWTWQRITGRFEEFRHWLHANQLILKDTGKFGNHRKYQSLDAYSNAGTGMTVGSYIEWVGPAHSHQTMFDESVRNFSSEPKKLFTGLYKSMNDVVGFGRTARFDYLTMIGKLNLAPITPEFTYLEGATGPKRGARLLFGGSTNANLSDSRLNELIGSLEKHLQLYFGMQVMEDALCNWQKSPVQYQYFGG